MFALGFMRVALFGLAAACAAAASDESRFPLIYAAGEGDADRVSSLLADASAAGKLATLLLTRSKDGETALHVAAIRGNPRVVAALLKAAREAELSEPQLVDAKTPPGQTLEMTPLMWAVYHGHCCASDSMVTQLLGAGADPGAADQNGKSLITMAQEIGRYHDIGSALATALDDAYLRGRPQGTRKVELLATDDRAEFLAWIAKHGGEADDARLADWRAGNE